MIASIFPKFSFTVSYSSLVFSPWPPLTSLLPAWVSSREPAGIQLNTVPEKGAVLSKISSPAWKDLCNHANISAGQKGRTKSSTDFNFFQQLGFMLVLSDHISVTLFLRKRLLWLYRHWRVWGFLQCFSPGHYHKELRGISTFLE